MTTLIKVENLSKKYILNHKHQGERYTALRDVMTNSVKNLFRKEQALHNNQEEFWALKDLNFEIKQGDRVGIIGRNGAGKSTLLKVLSRIVEPTAGRVKMKGRVASLLEVGTGFHGDLTGRENIFLNGAILGMKKNEIQRKFDEIVFFAEVDKFLDTPVKRYSSGMYVRLAFSVAAHLEPEILIVDEVLAVGDSQFQKKCIQKMEHVGKDGATVLFVSHNLSLIQSLCKTGLLIHHGELKLYTDKLIDLVKNYSQLGDHNMRTRTFEKKRVGDNFDLIDFKFVNNLGNEVEPFFSRVENNEVFVEIQISAFNIDDSLTIGYSLYDENEVPIYWNYHTDKELKKISLGVNIIRFRLPIELLNIGMFTIRFIASLHFREWLEGPSSNIELRFEVLDLDGSDYFRARRPVLLAPVIDCEIFSQNKSKDIM